MARDDKRCERKDEDYAQNGVAEFHSVLSL